MTARGRPESYITVKVPAWATIRFGRILLAALLTGSVVGVAAPAAEASFGVSSWEAYTCVESTCKDTPPSGLYLQAAGHPNFGITDFGFKFTEGLPTVKTPEGNVKDVRVDLPQGLSVNPEATVQCTEAQLNASECPPESKVGEDEATGTANFEGLARATLPQKFPVFNMARNPGEPARFGVEIKIPLVANVRSYLEGGISWHHETETAENSGVPTGDYHEFFEIKEFPKSPELVESRLIFWGVPQEHSGVGTPTAFLTLPSTCSSKPITYLHVDSYQEPWNFLKYQNETPLATTGCGSLAFHPGISLEAETAQSDQPDGVRGALHVPLTTASPSQPNSPNVSTAEVTLPEGMTLNPSAAHGLESCSNGQIGLGTNNAIGCPAASQLGTVVVEAPGVPAGALTGSIYLAQQESQDPESGREFRVFLVAEAPQFGVGVRLEAELRVNQQTGRVTAVIANSPQIPFENFRLQLKGGALAPFANPLLCAVGQTAATVTPYTGEAAALASSPFATTGCASSPPPFKLAQSTQTQSSKAGAYTPYTLNFARADGQQYLQRVSTTLPGGLLGAIPSVTLCGEPQAAQGKCAAASQIGTATVLAGAGSTPYSFSGPVSLTGPFGGAPYGLSVAIPAVAGPFNLGTVVTRATLNVGLYSGRVTATSVLPTIVGGVPLRLKGISIAINRANFLFNPTSCGALASESVLGSTLGATQSLSSPLTVSGCAALPFKPSLSASTGAKSSKANGASLEVKVTQGLHQANIRQVILSLPRALPSRLTTLQKACPVARFEDGEPPGTCPSTSRVGGATVSTPVLAGKLAGPAYLVSHGGGAFPDLDLVVRGDGVEVVLVGHTQIASGTTTSKFEALPDVPITGVAVDLTTGARSLLGANGVLCKEPLVAPTTMIAQSGTKITRRTTITVTGCPVAIGAHRTSGTRAILTVLAPGAGRISAGGRDLRLLERHVSRAGKTKISVQLTRAGTAALHRAGRLKIRLRVGFVPHSHHGSSQAFTTVIFRS
jgi:hypothetical protein